MDLNSREKMILMTLYHSSKPLTTTYLSQITEVSTRTVKNDIEKIKLKVDPEKIRLMTKPRVGIWLEVDDEAKSEFKKLINVTNVILNPVLPEERVYFIINSLIRNNHKFITFEDMAFELFVSRSTIVKDMEKVEEYLQKHQVRLMKKARYGMKLMADEREIREVKSTVLKSVITKSNVPLDEDLTNLFKGVDVKQIKGFVQSIESRFEIVLSDLSFQDLLIYLVVAINRRLEGYEIQMDNDELDLLKCESEWLIALEMAKKISESFNIEMDIREVGYLTIQLAGAKLQNDVMAVTLRNSDVEDLNPQLYKNLKSILESLSERLDVELKNDEKLFTGLFVHLKTALNRVKNGIKIDNPLLEDIKKNYRVAYEIAIFVSQRLSKIYGYEISQDETGYIALYFGAYMERHKAGEKKKTAIIICSTGIGTAQLLVTKMTKLFPDIQILSTLSSFKATKMLEEGLITDMILTTVPFESDHDAIVQVSPLLLKEDIQKIEKILREKSIDDTNFKGESTIFKYIEEDLCFFKETLDNQADILKKMADNLKNQGYVENGFYESLLEREKFSSTSLGNLIAIPHPYEGYVKTPKLSMMTLIKPIHWGQNKVQIIFMIALDSSISHEFRNIYEELFRIIANETTIKKLLLCEDYSGFIEKI